MCIRDSNTTGPNLNAKEEENDEDVKRTIKFSPRPQKKVVYSSSLDESTSSPTPTSTYPPTKFPSPKTRTWSESTTTETGVSIRFNKQKFLVG